MFTRPLSSLPSLPSFSRRFVAPLVLCAAASGCAGSYGAAQAPEPYVVSEAERSEWQDGEGPIARAERGRSAAANGEMQRADTGADDALVDDEELAAQDNLAALASGQSVVVGAPAAGDEASAALAADTEPGTVEQFRGTLAPHGTWLDDNTYGTVWVPSRDEVGDDFVPYQTAGRWAYDDEYVWVSDYSWGWAPFHYGRWVQLAGYGWAWIPGRTYSGAWVTWRTGPSGYGYVGWAPMAPSYYWWGGYAYSLGGYGPGYGPYPYSYCATNYLFAPDMHRHARHDARHDRHTVPYQPPPRVAASPQVNERTAASPSVDGRTAAVPRLNMASGLRGPSPASLGIAARDVARVEPASMPSVAKAQRFDRTATSRAAGVASERIGVGALGRQMQSAAAAPAPLTRSQGAGLSTRVATAPRFVDNASVRAAQQGQLAAPRPMPTGSWQPQALAPSGAPAERAPRALSSTAASAPRFQGVEPRSLPQRAVQNGPRFASPGSFSPSQVPSYGASSFSRAPSAATAPSRSFSRPSGSSSFASPSFSRPSSSSSSSSFSRPSSSGSSFSRPSSSSSSFSRPSSSSSSSSFSRPSSSGSSFSRPSSSSSSFSRPSMPSGGGSRSMPSSGGVRIRR